MTPTRLAGIGAFVIGGILLFAIGLFLIGERRMLFQTEVHPLHGVLAHQRPAAGRAGEGERHGRR